MPKALELNATILDVVARRLEELIGDGTLCREGVIESRDNGYEDAYFQKAWNFLASEYTDQELARALKVARDSLRQIKCRRSDGPLLRYLIRSHAENSDDWIPSHEEAAEHAMCHATSFVKSHLARKTWRRGRRMVLRVGEPLLCVGDWRCLVEVMGDLDWYDAW